MLIDVLGLAGTQLTFFIAAHIILYFGFVINTVLIAHQCLVPQCG